MCLYNYNLNNNNDLNEKEYELLKQIYKSIETNDTDNVKLLTEELIGIQTSEERIKILNEAISFL